MRELRDISKFNVNLIFLFLGQNIKENDAIRTCKVNFNFKPLQQGQTRRENNAILLRTDNVNLILSVGK